MIPNAFHCIRFGACHPGGHVNDCRIADGGVRPQLFQVCALTAAGADGKLSVFLQIGTMQMNAEFNLNRCWWRRGHGSAGTAAV